MDADAALERRFAELGNANVQAVLATHDPFFQNRATRIVQLARTRGLPLIGYRDTFVLHGAVMSYGPSLREQTRKSAELVHGILQGTSPAALGIKQPDLHELFINRTAAERLGFSIPESLLAQAGKNIVD
jgi:putative ABC transport system substrate-binding protein